MHLLLLLHRHSRAARAFAENELCDAPAPLRNWQEALAA
jgi:hypothetical protein